MLAMGSMFMSMKSQASCHSHAANSERGGTRRARDRRAGRHRRKVIRRSDAAYLIVSNRLPISVRRVDGELHVEPSAGGLATGLAGVHGGGRRDCGSAGPAHSEQLTADESATLSAPLRRARTFVPVDLTADEVDRYYERFCNGVLWPLFHYLLGQLPLEVERLRALRGDQRRFADAVVARSTGRATWSGSTTTS